MINVLHIKKNDVQGTCKFTKLILKSNISLFYNRFDTEYK